MSPDAVQRRSAGSGRRTASEEEAYLKGLGVGLAVDPATVTVSLPPDEPSLLATHAGAGHPAGWSLAALDLAEGYVAALAAQGPARRIRRSGSGPSA